MAYNIYKSDGSQLVALDDYIIDNTTLSINLIGKNVSGYGAQQNENFLYLLENFSKETPPATPVAGQLWYDKAVGVMRPMVYDGGNWRPLAVTLFSNTTTDTTMASGATISSHAPGDFWFNTSKQQLFINTGSAYTLIGPEAVPGFGQTKLSSETLLDNGLNPHPVIKIVLDGEVIGVLSNETFMGGVEASALGFSNVYRGLTLKDYNPLTRYSTTSTDVVFHGLHEQLDDTYPRRDQDEHITGNWFFDNNYMLQFGSAGNSKISYQEPGGGFPNKLVLEHGNGTLVFSSNGNTLTFNGDSLVPNATETQDIGSSSLRFNNVFTNSLNAGSALTDATIVGTWNLGASSKFNPSSDNGNELGQAALRWKDLYTFGINSGADQGTIKGNWQLESSIEFIPQTDGSNDLGTSGRKFNTVYTNGISASDPFTALSVTGELTLDGSLIPAEDQVYNIGSPQSTYNTIYSSSVVSDTANIGSLSATVNQLLDSFANSISRFDRDAQLTANSDSRLPTQKAVKAYVDSTKNALLSLISSVQSALQNSINGLEFVPAGTVFYHAASTAPSGFLVCDGKLYSAATYPSLYNAIAYTYGGGASGTVTNYPVTVSAQDALGDIFDGYDPPQYDIWLTMSVALPSGSYSGARLFVVTKDVVVYESPNSGITSFVNDGIETYSRGSVAWQTTLTGPYGEVTFTAYNFSVTIGGNGNYFKVPDLRGEFIRGWDAAGNNPRRGADPDANRQFGSNQDDEFKSHKHGVTLSQEQGGSHDQYGFPQVDWTGPNVYHSSTEPDGSTCYRDGRGNFMHANGGDETRPRNVALLPIIKY